MTLEYIVAFGGISVVILAATVVHLLVTGKSENEDTPITTTRTSGVIDPLIPRTPSWRDYGYKRDPSEYARVLVYLTTMLTQHHSSPPPRKEADIEEGKETSSRR